MSFLLIVFGCCLAAFLLEPTLAKGRDLIKKLLDKKK